jgi:hypothetical protein
VLARMTLALHFENVVRAKIKQLTLQETVNDLIFQSAGRMMSAFLISIGLVVFTALIAHIPQVSY